MAGTKRKRQRLEQNAAPAPIGSKEFAVAAASAETEAEKDDEERELESFLFGTTSPTTLSSKANQNNTKGKAVAKNDDAIQSNGLDHVLDEDLFMIDEPGPDVELPDVDLDAEPIAGATENSDNDEDESDDASASSSNISQDLTPVVASSFFPSRSSTKKKAAWLDPSDVHLSISLATDKRLRKLRDAPSEDTIGGKTYESKLRRKYEELNPTPEWAQSARDRINGKSGAKRRRGSSVTSDEDRNNDGEALTQGINDLLRDTSGILASSSKGTALPSGSIAIERLRDANHAAVSEGSVTAAKFHPSPSVSVMMTIGMDRRLRLFNIDGLTNPLLQTLYIPDLPTPSSSSCFHPSGNSILLTSTSRPYFYTYDLQSGRAVKSARGLWAGAPGGEEGGGETRSLEIARFDEYAGGRLLAVGGRRGYVHLVDWGSSSGGSGGGGGGQVVASLKAHSPIKDVAWVSSSDGQQKKLMTLTQDAEVYIWDVGTRRCISRWKDEGNFGANILAASRNGRHSAVGSSTGIINLYGSDASSPSSSPTFTLGRETRKPLKTITNLTTSITNISFDASSQIMAIASRAKKDQFRLVHVPTMTTFANWPTSGTPLGTVTSVDFSAGSEYLAIGNTRGKVTLWGLRHFTAGS